MKKLIIFSCLAVAITIALCNFGSNLASFNLGVDMPELHLVDKILS